MKFLQVIYMYLSLLHLPVLIIFLFYLFLVKHSHHWKKRQALIDDIIAHDVGEDEEFAADDEYPDLHSNFVTKASELRELHEKCNRKHANFWEA